MDLAANSPPCMVQSDSVSLSPWSSCPEHVSSVDYECLTQAKNPGGSWESTAHQSIRGAPLRTGDSVMHKRSAASQSSVDSSLLSLFNIAEDILPFWTEPQTAVLALDSVNEESQLPQASRSPLSSISVTSNTESTQELTPTTETPHTEPSPSGGPSLFPVDYSVFVSQPSTLAPVIEFQNEFATSEKSPAVKLSSSQVSPHEATADCSRAIGADNANPASNAMPLGSLSKSICDLELTLSRAAHNTASTMTTSTTKRPLMASNSVDTPDGNLLSSRVVLPEPFDTPQQLRLVPFQYPPCDSVEFSDMPLVNAYPKQCGSEICKTPPMSPVSPMIPCSPALEPNNLHRKIKQITQAVCKETVKVSGQRNGKAVPSTPKERRARNSVSVISRKPKTYAKPIASRFCHVCSRMPRRGQTENAAVCGNMREGLCRKIVCRRCFVENGWDFPVHAALDKETTRGSIGDSRASSQYVDKWLCPHCAGRCPPRSQCHIYNRVNARRKRVSEIEGHVHPAVSAASTARGGKTVLPVDTTIESISMEEKTLEEAMETASSLAIDYNHLIAIGQDFLPSISNELFRL